MAEPPPQDAALGLGAAVLQGSVDPILVLSTDGVVLESNPATASVFGTDMVGTHFGVPAVPGDAAEVDLLTRSGNRTAELRMGEAIYGGQQVYVATLRDVTDRKRVEAALRDFVNSASHEFRTPLFAIAGFAETLELQWDELDDAVRQRYIEIIHRQARRLSRLSGDLLTLTQLDGEILEPVKVRFGVRMVAERACELLRDHEVRLEVPEEVRAFADPDHTEEVLINLLSNAVKYGDPPFEVHATQVDHEVEVLVVDHGAGVPRAFRDRMFERFSRERNAARAASGTGLGLAIVDGLLTHNDGRIEYADTPGGGATFRVWLPSA